MTERQKERQSIINTLIGPMESIGESHVDSKVIENMDFAEDVILYLVDTLARNAEYRGYEKSRIDIAVRSQVTLKYIKEIIDGVL
mgnify:CR=1 FL=1